MLFFLGVTILLGLIFIIYQMLEFYYLEFLFSDSSYGSIFFLGTGFHGFHVTLGIFIIRVNFTLCHFNYLRRGRILFDLRA